MSLRRFSCGSFSIAGSMKKLTGISTRWPGCRVCSVKQKHSILVKYWPYSSGDTLNVARPVTELGIDEEADRHLHPLARLQGLLREAEALDLGEILAVQLRRYVERGATGHRARDR